MPSERPDDASLGPKKGSSRAAGQPVKAGRQRLPAAERRIKIIAAARSVFVEQAYSGARTKQIAERAGVTEAFLYRHFESKAEMYAAAILDPIREGLERLADEIDVLHDTVLDPIAFLRASFRRSLRFYLEYSQPITVALYSEQEGGREFYATLLPTLDRIGARISDRAGWSKQGIDPKTIRRTVLGAPWAIGLDYALRSRPADVDELANNLTGLYVGGIKE